MASPLAGSLFDAVCRAKNLAGHMLRPLPRNLWTMLVATAQHALRMRGPEGPCKCYSVLHVPWREFASLCTRSALHACSAAA